MKRNISTFLYVLLMVLFLCLGCCYSQVSIIQFNSNWNSKNTFDISILKDCEKSVIIICDHPELQKKYNIKSVPTIIVFNDTIEVIRFEANILMQLTYTTKDIQKEIDKIYLAQIE